jgi:alkylation response protein AidB-like acyl-CoA dehydrogenase
MDDTELTDTERLLRDTFRGWFTSELAPQVAAMESGTITPYALMRTMHQALGLDAMLTRTAGGATRGGDATASGGLDANVARYARTTFVVEMARVSPSFALSWAPAPGSSAPTCWARARRSRSSSSRCPCCGASASAPGASPSRAPAAMH